MKGRLQTRLISVPNVWYNGNDIGTDRLTHISIPLFVAEWCFTAWNSNGTAHKHVNRQHGNIGPSNGKLTVVYDAEHGEHNKAGADASAHLRAVFCGHHISGKFISLEKTEAY